MMKMVNDVHSQSNHGHHAGDVRGIFAQLIAMSV